MRERAGGPFLIWAPGVAGWCHSVRSEYMVRTERTEASEISVLRACADRRAGRCPNPADPMEGRNDGDAHGGDARRANRTGAAARAAVLTGVRLPGLSANPLAVEPWWDDRPLRLWIARRLYDYSHLKHEKGPGVRPWILEGRELERGPDNELLIRCHRPVAWIAECVISEAVQAMEGQNDRWGPLRRPAAG